MEHVAHRCVAGSAAVLIAGGLAVGLIPMAQTLPDVQIRNLDLTALNVNAGAVQVDTLENHVRPDAIGAGELGQSHPSLSDLLFGHDGGFDGLTGSANLGELTVDENLVKDLLGGGLGPDVLQGELGLTPDVGAPSISIPGLAPNDPASAASAASAAGAAVTAFAAAAQGLVAAQQAFTSGVAAAEMQLNEQLVAAQAAAAAQLSSSNPELSGVVSAIFDANNKVLASDEASLNSLLGVNLDTQDIHNSLLGDLDSSSAAAQADWGSLLQGFNQGDLEDLIRAFQVDNLIPVLGGIDWAGIFANLF